MLFLYNIGLKIYVLGIYISSIFNQKAKAWINGRKNVFSQLKQLEGKKEIRYWFHCASLGEFEQGRPIIEEIKKQNPENKILLTFFSPSGYEIRKNYQFADYIFYLPIDSKKNARQFIEFTNPQKVFFIKYEFWYHYLKTLSQKGIPTYLVSAIFRKNQIFFKSYGVWFRKMLNYFKIIFVQDEKSKELLEKINCKNIIVSGDTRFDRVWQIAKQNSDIESLHEYLTTNKNVLVAGSTWPKDEEIICEYINENPNKLIYILVPHNIENTHIKNIEKRLNTSYIKYSNILNGQKTDNEKVIIIDTIGILSKLYKYATITYVGGGFGVGIHNILEACVFGAPVIFGPNNQKFNEAADAKNLNFGFEIKNKDEFKSIVDEFLNNQVQLKVIHQTVNDYFIKRIGAFNNVLKRI